jgi:hypothetical protein
LQFVVNCSSVSLEVPETQTRPRHCGPGPSLAVAREVRVCAAVTARDLGRPRTGSQAGGRAGSRTGDVLGHGQVTCRVTDRGRAGSRTGDVPGHGQGTCWVTDRGRAGSRTGDALGHRQGTCWVTDRGCAGSRTGDLPGHGQGTCWVTDRGRAGSHYRGQGDVYALLEPPPQRLVQVPRLP